MRDFSVFAGCALVLASALLAAYVSGETLSGFAPALIWILILIGLTSYAPAFLRRPKRWRSDALLKAARLFDTPPIATVTSEAGQEIALLSRISGRMDGREAEFSFWLPQDHPLEMPKWALIISAAGSSDDGDDREPAFSLRISCASTIAFEVKKWGVSPGPPFRTFKLDAELTAEGPGEFSAKTVEALSFWRSREDCRSLTYALIQKSGIWQISVTGFRITVWWPTKSVSNWSAFGIALPSAVETLVDLARALDGLAPSRDRKTRKCSRCFADLGRSDAFCSCCGAPWWEEEAARSLEHC